MKFFKYRCKQWVQCSGNISLLNVPSTRLHKRYYICSDHFECNQFYNANKQVLLPTAVPTKSLSKLSNNDMKRFPLYSPEDVCFIQCKFILM